MDKLTEEQATTLWDNRRESKRCINDNTGEMTCYHFYSALDGKNYYLNYEADSVIDKDSTILEIKNQVIEDLQDQDYEDLTPEPETEETI